MDREHRPEVPSTSANRRNDLKRGGFGKRSRRSKRQAEGERDQLSGTFAKRQPFWRDADLIWFFQLVGKDGQRKLKSVHELRRWSRINQAVSGLWRLCLYFANPHRFARPLVAPLVDDDGRHGAEPLYGLLPSERIKLFRKDDQDLESRRLYAVRVQRDLDLYEVAGRRLIDKDYAEYRCRRATPSRREPEVIVSPQILRRVVRPQFEYRRDNAYPTVDTTAPDVIGQCFNLREITWSTWRDYAVNPDAARTLLHKRRVPGVVGMSDQQALTALSAAIAAETRMLEAEEVAEEKARAAKAARAQQARRKPTLVDWLSSTLALELSVAEIARAAKLPQREVRWLLAAQGCPGVTLAEGEPTESWLNASDAGRAFKETLAAAAQERRQADAARRA